MNQVTEEKKQRQNLVSTEKRHIPWEWKVSGTKKPEEFTATTHRVTSSTDRTTNYEGTTSDVQALPSTFLLRPGLRGFGFSYHDPDHHIVTVATGHGFQEGEGALRFWPENALISFGEPGRTWDWHLHNVLLPEGTLFARATENFDNGTYAESGDFPSEADAQNYTIVLVGFNFSFSRTHHLESIGIQWLNEGGPWGKICSYFHDGSGNRPMLAEVTIAFVPKKNVRISGSTSGKARGTISSAIEIFNPVLQGFLFTFQNGDHHIHEIKLNLAPGSVELAYRDSNGDDPYSWEVWYADLL